ncbi:hypothetical protein AB1N83_011453 [Pleurotus pulmonarius]
MLPIASSSARISRYIPLPLSPNPLLTLLLPVAPRHRPHSHTAFITCEDQQRFTGNAAAVLELEEKARMASSRDQRRLLRKDRQGEMMKKAENGSPRPQGGAGAHSHVRLQLSEQSRRG